MTSAQRPREALPYQRRDPSTHQINAASSAVDINATDMAIAIGR